MFVDSKLAIYVQEWENRKCIDQMSSELTKLLQNADKGVREEWKKGDICVAQRSSDGKYHRAEIQRVHTEQQRCLVRINLWGFSPFATKFNSECYAS